MWRQMRQLGSRSGAARAPCGRHANSVKTIRVSSNSAHNEPDPTRCWANAAQIWSMTTDLGRSYLEVLVAAGIKGQAWMPRVVCVAELVSLRKAANVIGDPWVEAE